MEIQQHDGVVVEVVGIPSRVAAKWRGRGRRTRHGP